MNYVDRLQTVIHKGCHCAKDIGDEWQTPEEEFKGIVRLFGPFSIDLFASHFNRKYSYYFTAKENALKQDWMAYCSSKGLECRGFANPPYSKPHVGLMTDGSTCTGLGEIVDKARQECEKGFYSVMVVPHSPEADWFGDALKKATDIWTVIGGRITFEPPKWYTQDPQGSKPSSARGGTSIFVFNPLTKGRTHAIHSWIQRDYLRQLGQELDHDLLH
ncbi:DNA N-6-adenine-methyltransferase [Celerinatantimonas sp. MCCC 1A17872]|uniref:DNA N-6-adenine-methyltransferase n=1 Tax=Celerinatantimonas sp. MCCC 1A17872 TaxID=3177514 RepID=UPI0038C0DC66